MPRRQLGNCIPPVKEDGVVTDKGVFAASNTAATAGGSTVGVTLGTAAAGVGIYFGSGAPTISAGKGSLYLRTDGSSSSTRAYSNSDGAATWVAVTTAS